MLTAAQLMVNVVANVGEAQTALERIGTETEAVGARASEAGPKIGAMSSFMHSFLVQQILFAAFAKAMAFMVAQIKDVATQTNAWQAATTQLKAVLDSTHGSAGITSTAAINLANAMSKVTTYNNSAVLSMENILLTFTDIKQNTFPQTTQVVLDLATAMHEDLKSAAVQVGKAIQDPVLGMTALRRVGVNFSKDQIEVVKQLVATGQKAKAQQMILAELQKEFGGSAKAAGTTFAGSLQILSNQFDTVKEKVGAQVIPALTNLFRGMEPFISGAASSIPIFFQKAGDALGQFGQVVGSIAPTIEGIVTTLVGHLMPGFKALGDALSATGKSFGSVKWSEVLGPVQTLAGKIGDLITNGLKVLAVVIRNIPWQTLGNAIGGVATVITGLLDFLAAHQEIIVAVGIAIAIGLIPMFAAWAVGAASAAVATIAATWPLIAITAVVALVVLGIIELVKHWGDITTALGHFKDLLGNVLGAIGNFIGAGLGAIGNFIGGVVAFFESLPGKILAAIGNMMKAVVQGIQNGASAVNNAVKNIPVLGGLVGGGETVIGGITSHLPHFAAGGLSAGGLAVVGEQGPEVVSLPGGSRVFPHGSGPSTGGSGAASQQPVMIQIDGRTIARLLMPHIASEIRSAAAVRHM